MAVTISGMFGSGKTYFADAPVIIDIDGLQWGQSSPFTIVRVEVVYNNKVIGDFREDTGGQTAAHFDISSALQAIWSDYDFSAPDAEVGKAMAALAGSSSQTVTRGMREYSLRVFTEYLDSTDNAFTQTYAGEFAGGKCLIGGMTEWERSLITGNTKRDVSALEHTGVRNGDASTKPIISPERVGKSSITSWVDVQQGYTKSIFYPASIPADSDDVSDVTGGWSGHAPLVLRDDIDYTDFIFVNRRGAVETCSGQMMESMDIEVSTTQYARVGRPSFTPSRSLMAIVKGGRRSWAMSSGYQTREWATWWTMEFLMARQWWMRIGNTFVPVVVEPAKKSTGIYDRSKQQMPHVDFTVTLALEG